MYKKLIEENQSPSLKRVLKGAVDYHFSNFTKLEKLAEPYSLRDRMKMVDAVTRLKANDVIKFEVQAYINHLRRLKHFIRFLQKAKKISRPENTKWKEIWYDIMDDNGVVNLLANKWAVHRSADDPRKEDTYNLHLTVLLNLEGPITMWGNGHMYLSIDKHQFYLFHYHPKVLNFIDWIFSKLESETDSQKQEHKVEEMNI